MVTLSNAYLAHPSFQAGIRPMGQRLDDTFNVLETIPAAEHEGIWERSSSYNTAPHFAEAIEYAAQKGLRTYAPAGTYALSSVEGTSAAFDMASKVHLFGAGEGATDLRWFGGDGHVIACANITDWSIRSMSIYGGRDLGVTSAGYHIIRCDTVDRFALSDLFLDEALFYGIGLQNGAITRAIVRNIKSRNSGSDAIDFKNKAGDANFGLVVDGFIVDGFDLLNNGSKAAVDIRGPATISNIHVKASFTSDSIGIRLRHGEVGDTNGPGGHYSSVTNWFVRDTGTKLGSAVCIAARDVNVGRGTARDCGTGVWLTDLSQNSQASDFTAVGCNNAALLEGTGNKVSQAKAVECVTGYRLRGTSNIVEHSTSKDSSTRGYYVESTAVNPELLYNRSSGDTFAILDQCTTTYKEGNQGFTNSDQTGIQDTRYVGSDFVGTTSTLTAVENRLYFIPLDIPSDMLADQVAISVSTGAGDTSCQAKMGLYRFFEGVPELLVLDFGTRTIGTGTGNQAIALSSQSIRKGKYALGLIVNRNGGAGAMPILAARTTVNSLLRSDLGASSSAFSSTSFADAMYADVTVGTWSSYALPSTAPTVTFSNDNVPVAGFRAT